MSNENHFVVGGTVQASGGTYISRRADRELLELCRAGDFAYVLTPRQLGKSSLMENTAHSLAEEGIRSVQLTLEQIGTVGVTPEAWYLGLLEIIQDELELKCNVMKWWDENAHFAVTQRFTTFFESVLLVEIKERVVIFVDEIDTTLSLGFTDDFFAAIRYFHNARAHAPELKRLSFVLIGAATPGDLIGDPQRTPFNIGHRVDLTDFTFEEALPLAEDLGLPKNQAHQVMRWILKWTSGHPYLTQKLCQKVVEQRRSDWSEADIDAIVSLTFFHTVKEPDENLKTVRDMLTKRAKPDLESVLTTYRAVRVGKKAVLDEEQSLVKNHLKLSGVVRREKYLDRASEGVALRLRNPIYHQVFDEAWVKEHMPVNWFARARKSGVLIVAILLAISVGVLTISWRRAVQKQIAAEENAFSLLQADFKSRDYLEYQKHASDDEQPLLSQTIYDEPAKGSLSLVVYADDSVRVSRKGPQSNPIVINTWIPKLPEKVEGPPTSPPPGPPPQAQSQITDDRYPFQLASMLAPTSVSAAARSEATAGNCLDPHPGAFRSWYGEKNGCWVAVYREWPDGCLHYQWYNACYNYWDTHPNGAPKVYWQRCVH